MNQIGELLKLEIPRAFGYLAAIVIPLLYWIFL